MKIAPSTKRNLKVTLQMSRDSNREWNLHIEDRASGLRIVDVLMSHEEFSNLMSTAHAAGKAEYYANPNIGKKMYVMDYDVNLRALNLHEKDSYEEKDRKLFLKSVYDYAEEKNPGWTADRDEYNHRRRSFSDYTYEVIMRKYEEVK